MCQGLFQRTSCFRAASLLSVKEMPDCSQVPCGCADGWKYWRTWTSNVKCCTIHSYAMGPLAAWRGSQKIRAWVQKVLRQFERRKVNHGLLFSRSQNHWRSGEWLGGRESEYICLDLVILFTHVKIMGLPQFLVVSFALDPRAQGACGTSNCKVSLPCSAYVRSSMSYLSMLPGLI